MDVRRLSAVALGSAIRNGDTTAEAAVRGALDAIAIGEPTLHAFITIEGDRAIERARELDRSSERAGRLHGVPIAIKDNLCVRGMKTTAGSRIVSCISALILSQISRGVPLGAHTPYHELNSKPGRPCSAKVGSSGASVERVFDAMPSARARVPSLAVGSNANAGSIRSCTLPLMMSVSAGVVPR